MTAAGLLRETAAGWRASAQVPVERFRRTTIGRTLTDPLFVTWTRWCAIAVWLVAIGAQCVNNGVPFDRTGLGVWIVAGLICFTIGKRNPLAVIVDWAPFLGVLIAYDLLRGAADTMGMPTWWHPQLDVDKFLFGGTEPTVWLQEHFRQAQVRWWDVATCVIYFSFFFAPYLLAGILWLRGRSEFRAWAGRFVTLSLLGFALFALIPSAPPWAAARCTAIDVADHPNNPTCLHIGSNGASGGGLLGLIHNPQPGTSHYVSRISTRGWSDLHLNAAASLVSEGQRSVDLVAAVPSLHAGGTMLLALFLWSRTRRTLWRVLLVAYVIAMPLALVYSAEHYVSDVLAGWLCAVLVHYAFTRWERRRKQKQAVDRLEEPPTASRMETPCPPVLTPSATTTSSISPSDADSSSPPARSTAAPAPPGTTVPSASS